MMAVVPFTLAVVVPPSLTAVMLPILTATLPVGSGIAVLRASIGTRLYAE